MKYLNKEQKALISLAIGGFGIGLTEFVIMGILPEVASSLSINIAQAGHFIAAYALGVVVGAPLLTLISHKFTAKHMLLGLMVWFTLFNTLSAFSPTYTVMLALRFLSGFPHGAFFGIGAVVAGKLAKKGKSAQAIALMFSGLTIANVLGVPLGTYLGQRFSWSASFLLVGLVGLLTLASLYFWMPNKKIKQVSSEKQESIFSNGELWTLIALTTIGTGGFFAWYSYIAPLVTDVANLPESILSYVLVIAGLGMVFGNFIGAKLTELYSPVKAVIISLTAMVVVLILNSLFASTGWVVLGFAFLIGLIAFTVSTPIQMAIIKASKGSEMIGSSLNQSAFNMGNASGAYFAGLPIAYGYSVTSAGQVGALLALFGVFIASSLLLYRKRKNIKFQQAIA